MGRHVQIVAACLLGGTAAIEVIRNGHYQLDIVDLLEEATMPRVEAWMTKKAQSGKTKCTLENAAVRREWSDLSVEQREEYTRAVLCLQNKPARAPKDEIPGALSRFDDFPAFHMTQAMMLHDTTHLFASHRYFIWAYEKALREECGYTGYQPYMNYERYADDPINSPMFNGNASSMGGNGGPNTYKGVPQTGQKPNLIPAAGGGGCVTEGPFKDMVVSLGPKSHLVDDVLPNPREDGLGSNPRCLRRDVNKWSIAGARANYTYKTIMDNPDIDKFYNRYLGQPPLKNDPYPWGIHNAGHYSFGGDPGGDFWCSPGDPAFFFHHGMLDRVWWIWQMQDPEKRVHQVPGQAAMNMTHPGTGGTLARRNEEGDLIVNLGWIAPEVMLHDLNDQLGGLDGEMCYVYV